MSAGAAAQPHTLMQVVSEFHHMRLPTEFDPLTAALATLVSVSMKTLIDHAKKHDFLADDPVAASAFQHVFQATKLIDMAHWTQVGDTLMNPQGEDQRRIRVSDTCFHMQRTLIHKRASYNRREAKRKARRKLDQATAGAAPTPPPVPTQNKVPPDPPAKAKAMPHPRAQEALDAAKESCPAHAKSLPEPSAWPSAGSSLGGRRLMPPPPPQPVPPPPPLPVRPPASKRAPRSEDLAPPWRRW